MIKTFLDKYLVLSMTLLVLLNFLLAPRSVVAYNTTNLEREISIVKIDKIDSLTKR